MSENSSGSDAGAGFTATAVPPSSPITPNAVEKVLPSGYTTSGRPSGADFFADIDTSSKPAPKADTSELLAGVAESVIEDIAGEAADASDEASDEAAEAAPKAAKVKTYKVKAGGKSADLPIDAKFSIPVDGKTTEVSFNDLVQNYNGKVGWDKRYTELDKSRKQYAQEKASFESDRAALNGGLEQFFNLVQTKKGPQAWAHLIKMAGLDGHYSLADLRSEVLTQAKQMESMSPAQREAFEAREQADYYKSENESIQERQRAQQAQAQAEAQLDQVLDSHSITRELYGSHHAKLVEGGISPQEITPEVVIDYHKRLDAYKTIRQAAEKFGDVSILKNDALVNRLRDFKLANPDFSASDIQGVLKSWRGEKRAKIVSDKVRQSKTASSASVRQPAPRPASKPYNREDYFF